MHDPKYFQQLVDVELERIQFSDRPAELYDPIRYMLNLGGKRMRPALLLMANEMFGGETGSAIGPALGIEVFHNFTLLHDDIMDKAPLRRSQPTVHVKWNPDIAILSGDTMFVKACQLMMQTDNSCLRTIMNDFLQTSMEVCEGQKLDMNFERQEKVTIADYVDMIALKTAVLLGSSLRIGATIGGASAEDASSLYDFGKQLGIAFQLHDDVLDAYGDPIKFGKQEGGDIIANKKTYLLLTAMESEDRVAVAELKRWMTLVEFNPSEKVSAIKEIFEKIGVRNKAEEELDRFFSRSLRSLDSIPLAEERKAPLRRLAERLMVRES
ncbi:MAG: polyprenyl synthetase family protein [Bacteroidota bacterium]